MISAAFDRHEIQRYVDAERIDVRYRNELGETTRSEQFA